MPRKANAPVMMMKNLPCENYDANDHKLNFILSPNAPKAVGATATKGGGRKG